MSVRNKKEPNKEKQKEEVDFLKGIYSIKVDGKVIYRSKK